jgi:hypothetical protein
MVVNKHFHPAVCRYLEELELELKKLAGVVPEDALCDAREFLIENAEALARSVEPPSEMVHFQWIIENYGAPEVVAQQYAICGSCTQFFCQKASLLSSNVEHFRKPGLAPNG